MKCSLTQAMAWIVAGVDPVGRDIEKAMDYSALFASLGQVETEKARNKIVFDCRDGKLAIYGKLTVMKQLIHDKEALDWAEESSFGYEGVEPGSYREGAPMFYAEPKIFEVKPDRSALPSENINSSNINWQENSIILVGDVEGHQLPDPELEEGATKSLFKYWFQARDCSINAIDLKNCFPRKTEEQSKRTPGRTTQYDWDDAWISVAAFVHKYGLPEKQADIKKLMRDAFGDPDRAPGETELKKKSSRLFNRKVEFID